MSDTPERTSPEQEPGPAPSPPGERWMLEGPGYFVSAVLVLLFVAALFGEGDMLAWAVSREALREGRYGTILSHMAAHGSLMHVGMNVSALVPLSAQVIWGGGAWPGNWLRCALLFLLSGLSGCLFFLLIHADNGVPMLGASGAIFGLWGVAARLGAERGTIVPLRAPQVRGVVRYALVSNVILFALLYVLSSGAGGLAWEAHLGGFLFGLFAAPWFARAQP